MPLKYAVNAHSYGTTVSGALMQCILLYFDFEAFLQGRQNIETIEGKLAPPAKAKGAS